MKTRPPGPPRFAICGLPLGERRGRRPFVDRCALWQAAGVQAPWAGGRPHAWAGPIRDFSSWCLRALVSWCLIVPRASRRFGRRALGLIVLGRAGEKRRATPRHQDTKTPTEGAVRVFSSRTPPGAPEPARATTEKISSDLRKTLVSVPQALTFAIAWRYVIVGFHRLRSYWRGLGRYGYG